jgi:hypothetical protein
MRLFTLFLLTILFLNSSNGQDSKKYDTETLIVLESILKNSKEGSIFHKTIVKEWRTPIESYVKDYLLEFYLCVNDIDKASVRISQEEVWFLKEKFSKQSVERIDRLIPDLKKKTTEKHKRFKTSIISMPVTFRNGTMALYYHTETYGGGFNLLQKRDNNWEIICSNSVWIE